MGIPEDSGPTPFDCPKNSRYQVTPSLYPVRIPTDQDARAAQSSLDHCALQDSHDRCPDGDGSQDNGQPIVPSSAHRYKAHLYKRRRIPD